MAVELTTKERAVLNGIANGLTYRELGRQLYFEERTVKGWALTLFQKLGVRNRAHAVAVAYQRGLLPATQDILPVAVALLDRYTRETGRQFDLRFGARE